MLWKSSCEVHFEELFLKVVACLKQSKITLRYCSPALVILGCVSPSCKPQKAAGYDYTSSKAQGAPLRTSEQFKAFALAIFGPVGRFDPATERETRPRGGAMQSSP
jgi:hypothetical protein